MARIQLQPEERLIIGADFKPPTHPEPFDTYSLVERLCDTLAGTGVTVKVNSALRASSRGPAMINLIQRDYGLEAFADYKLCDISETMATDAALLRRWDPGFLTVMCSAGPKGLAAVKKELPHTKVLGVTVLTSLTEEDVSGMNGRPIPQTVLFFARWAIEAGLNGLVCSPKEAELLRGEFGDDLLLVTPAIRPLWSAVQNDDQNLDRVMTPQRAIQAGADYIVVGRPIVQAGDRLEAVERTLEEIASIAP